MPGSIKHHTDKFRRCVDKVVATGKDEDAAYAICTTSMKEAGEPIFEGLASGSEEELKALGDTAGHEFHGNQYTDGAAAGLGSHEVLHPTKTVTDLGKSWQHITVESKWKFGIGAKRSKELRAKKAKLAEKGWVIEPGSKGNAKLTHFKSPYGHSKEQADEEFRGATADEAILASLSEHESDDEMRELHLLGATGQVRHETHDGKDYLVVPVVALMEGVIHAVNASTPEFVPLETLQRAAATWDGRPIMRGHPTKDGRPCPANSPAVLAASGIGQVFNTRIQGKKLLCEAWIEKAKAEKVDPAMLARLLAGTGNEVSVGAFVVTDGVAGEYQGKRFMASWREAHGDHLAFLPVGKGACSQEMGCGTHRAAMQHLVTAEAFEPLVDDGARVNAIFELLQRVIPEDCPACKGTGSVEGNPCETCGGNGTLKIAAGARHSSSDVALIQAVHDHATKLGANCDRTNYKLMQEKPTAGEPTLRAACGCQGEQKMSLNKEKRAELVASLVTDKYSGFKEGDEPFLETASDARLEEFRAAAETRKAEADAHSKLETDQRNAAARLKVTEDKLKALEERQPTEDEFLNSPAGATLRTLVAEKKAQDAEERESMIRVLKAVGANTEEELKAMDNAQLRTLAKYAKVEQPNYAGRGLPVRRDAGTEEDYTPPDPYAAGIKALQSKAVN